MKELCAPSAALLSFVITSAPQEIKVQKPPVSTRAVVSNEDPGDGAEIDLATIASKKDTLHWVEVEGTPEVWNGLLYLRASRVMLAPSKPQQ